MGHFAQQQALLTIKEGFDFQSFDGNISDDIETDSGAPTVASVEDQVAAETLFLLIFLPWQSFAKMAFFLMFRANCIKEGHFEQGWLHFPEKKQVEASDPTAASMPGSVCS